MAIQRRVRVLEILKAAIMIDEKPGNIAYRWSVLALFPFFGGLLMGLCIPSSAKELIYKWQQPPGLAETLAKFDEEAWQCRSSIHQSSFATNEHCQDSQVLEGKLREFSAENQFTYTTEQYFQLLRARLLVRDQKISHLQMTQSQLTQ